MSVNVQLPGGGMYRGKPFAPLQFVLADSDAAPYVAGSSKVTLNVDSTLSASFASRNRKAQVVAVMFRIRGECAIDNAGGALTMHATRHQLLALWQLNVTNSFATPYFQKQLDLASVDYLAQLVNFKASITDRYFWNDDATTQSAPPRGVRPSRILDPAVVVGAAPQNPYIGIGSADYAGYDSALDIRDSAFRALEQRVQIRGAAPATVPIDLRVCMPLTAAHYGSYDLDSIPLPVIESQEAKWAFQLSYVTNPNNRLIGFDGGSITFNAIEMYFVCRAIRANDDYAIGLPYTVRQSVYSDPFTGKKGEVMLFAGNMPRTNSTETDTVDARAYIPGVEFPNVQTDFTVGNQWIPIDGDGVQTDPATSQNTSPRTPYMGWNIESRMAPRLCTGLPDEVAVFSRAALTGTRGYTTEVLPLMEDTLGPISTCPVRIITCNLIDVDGIPGNFSTDGTCAPRVTLSGSTFDIATDGLSSLKNVTVISLNTDKGDTEHLKALGTRCCAPSGGKIEWARIAMDPNNSAGVAIAEATGGWKQKNV